MGSIIGVLQKLFPAWLKAMIFYIRHPAAEAQNISKQITNKISNKTGLTGDPVEFHNSDIKINGLWKSATIAFL